MYQIDDIVIFKDGDKEYLDVIIDRYDLPFDSNGYHCRTFKLDDITNKGYLNGKTYIIKAVYRYNKISNSFMEVMNANNL